MDRSIKYTGPLARDSELSFNSYKQTMRELADDLSHLSEEDRNIVYNEVIDFLNSDSEFANTCHAPDTGRFCETQTATPNPLTGKTNAEKGKLVLGTLRSVWKEKVSTLTKVNIAVGITSAAGFLTNPGFREMLTAGTLEAMVPLAIGFSAMLWKESKVKR